MKRILQGLSIVFFGSFVVIALISNGLVRAIRRSPLAQMLAIGVVAYALAVGTIGFGAWAYLNRPDIIVRAMNFGRLPVSQLLHAQTLTGGPGFALRMLEFSVNVAQATGDWPICTVTGTGDMVIYNITGRTTTALTSGGAATISVHDNSATNATWLTATSYSGYTLGAPVTMTSPALRVPTLNGNIVQFTVAGATITAGVWKIFIFAGFSTTSGNVTATCS